MDLNQLKIFASLAQTLNFSKTAKQFYLTQPAVSHHIKALENSLGVTLLRRTNHKVVLTAEGEELYTYARQILDMAQTAENRLRNIAEGRLGHIRVAAISSSSDELSNCLGLYCQRFPLIQVDVDLVDCAAMMRAMTRDEYDFYFAVEAMLPVVNRYEKIVVNRDRLHLFAHRDIAPTLDMNDWETIGRYPFVSVPRSDIVLSNRIRNIFKQKGCAPRVVNYYNRAESVIISVNAGVGLAILPSALGRIYSRPNVVTLPIDGDDAESISIIAWEPNPSTAAAVKFLEVIRELYPNDLAEGNGKKHPHSVS
jgi:DNA-binding transcriptional LysR family regulator